MLKRLCLHAGRLSAYIVYKFTLNYVPFTRYKYFLVDLMANYKHNKQGKQHISINSRKLCIH